jgi:hypothetical protein
MANFVPMTLLGPKAVDVYVHDHEHEHVVVDVNLDVYRGTIATGIQLRPSNDGVVSYQKQDRAHSSNKQAVTI